MFLLQKHIDLKQITILFKKICFFCIIKLKKMIPCTVFFKNSKKHKYYFKNLYDKIIR